MILFWSLTALMLALGLVLVVPPLLRQAAVAGPERNAQNIAIAREHLAELERERQQGGLSDEEFDQGKLELEALLLQDVDEGSTAPTANRRLGQGTLLALVLLLPLFTITLYQQLGSPGLIDNPLPGPQATAADAKPGSAPAGSMADLAVKLRQRLEGSPDDADGWFLLGRTHMSLRDYPQAVMAFERTRALVGDDPGLLLSLADALIMAHNGQMAGRPAELVARARQLDPDNPTGLWMAGLIAESTGDYAEALRLWQQLLPQLADAPREQQQLSEQIARVSAKAGLLPPVDESTPEDAAGAALRLSIDLAPALEGQVPKGATLFIYAKAMQGPRFPLAAVRRPFPGLPLEVILDDRSAVMAGAKLSDFQRVRVGARLSASGDAIAQSGDLVGEVADVAVDESGVIEVTIDRVVP